MVILGHAFLFCTFNTYYDRFAHHCMTTKFEESTAFRKQEKAGSGSNVSPEEEAEFRRKIQEVARSNEGFSDLVDRYLGKDD